MTKTTTLVGPSDDDDDERNESVDNNDDDDESEDKNDNDSDSDKNNDNDYSSDVAVDNKREEISLDFEDMDGHWEEAKKGKKKKKKQEEEKKRKQQMVDYSAGGKPIVHTENTNEDTPTSSDEAGTVDDENKENSSLNGKLERRTNCHKGLRKDVIFETRDQPRPRPPRPITLVSAFSTNKCSRPIRSLADMLEEEEKDVEQIPDEEIIRFLLSADETAKRRKELRENLRRRFADFCNCHHARNCPSKSF